MSAAVATAAPVAQELLRVDPRTLVVGANARLDVRLHKAFIRSIGQRGVLEPVVAYRGEGGELVVLFGQRRTLAAVQAGRDTVPVMVVPRPEESDRIIDQVSENDHREGLLVGERVAAFEQLSAFGVSAAQIVKQTARPRGEVDRALAVAKSRVARAAVDRWAFLTLEQAAAVAEFDGDDEAVKQLVVAAKQGGFDHMAQRLRDARDEAAARDVVMRELAESGVMVVERPTFDHPAVKRLGQLLHDGVELTEGGHIGCPGHAAFLETQWIRPDEPEAHAEQDDADGDGELDAAGRAEPYRGWVPVFVCTDFAAYRHTLRWEQTRTGGNGAGKSAGMSDREREQTRQQRRDVIASNKDWDSAQTVRRRWLRTFLARKTAPAGAVAFVAGSLAAADHEITRALTSGHRLAHELLGLGDQAPTLGRRTPAVVGLVEKAGAGRAQQLLLGLVLAAYEDVAGRHSWRQVSDSTSRYLRFLEASGYELSAVEQRACHPHEVVDAVPLTAA